MMNDTYVPKFGTLKGKIILLGLAAALIIGLALASPAHGAGLSQDEKGDMSGQVTLAGQNAAGLTVELRKRNNGGEDTLIISTKTDGAGTYHFTGQPSAPNDAFYYVRFLGGKGALSAWYSFPIIYIMGSQVSVPAVELADVELVETAQNAALSLPATLRWKARKMGETYRVYVYTEGKTDKPVLDSGSLGTSTEFALSEGSLPTGKYEALVQVRDTVVGYGQSQSRYHFTVGVPAQDGTSSSTQGGAQVAPAVSPAPTQGSNQPAQDNATLPGKQTPQPDRQSGTQPNIKLHLTSDKTSVGPGESMTYKVEVENAGSGVAAGLIVTDKLPVGVSLDASQVKSTSGKVSADGDSSTVTVNLESLAPGSKATIEIPVSVKQNAGSNLSNQASAQYVGASSPVQSNAYIAQVASLSAPEQGQLQQSAEQPAAGQQGSANAPAAPAPVQPAAPQNTGDKAPAANPPAAKPQQPAASQPQQPKAAPKSNIAGGTQAKAPSAPAARKSSAPVPQTGGAFPVVFASLLLLITLFARYLRGAKYRRT